MYKIERRERRETRKRREMMERIGNEREDKRGRRNVCFLGFLETAQKIAKLKGRVV